jgi:hypothetical protein
VSERRTRGRPPIGPPVLVRVPPEQADYVRSRAERDNVPLASVLRALIAEAIAARNRGQRRR